MNSGTRDLHVVVMYLLSAAAIFTIVISDLDNIWFDLLFSMCWLFSFTVRNLFIYKTGKSKKAAFATYGLELLLLAVLNMNCAGGTAELLFCITIGDCFIVWLAVYGIPITLLGFLVYTVPGFIYHSNSLKQAVSVMIQQSPLFVMTGLISYLLGRILKNNVLIEQTMQSAEAREVVLKNAYDKLSMAYENLDEMASVKERNRIAREIHDTVGHTLTTVIVEMEAGRMLAPKDQELASEKFLQAQKQANKALDELRASVRLLAKSESTMDLAAEVGDLVSETEAHTGVNIKSRVEVPESVERGKGSLLIRCLKEGLANGIRHGAATAFFLELTQDGQNLRLLLQDNGRGCDSVVPGFGLENMKKSILNHQGEMDVESEAGEGFELRIQLPLNQ